MTKKFFEEKSWHKDLPYECYGVLATTGETIKVKFGKMGYYEQDEEVKMMCADKLNREVYGVDKATAKAMVAGSMFGWDVPASNPEVWRKDDEWVV